jgi:hypothetical protein
VALGQVFSKYFGFPCQFSFHRLLHTHHLSSGAGTIGQIVDSISPHPKTLNKKLVCGDVLFVALIMLFHVRLQISFGGDRKMGNSPTGLGNTNVQRRKLHYLLSLGLEPSFRL